MMNKHYWGLWSLLALALALFAAMSYWPDGLCIGGFELNKSSFARNVSELMVAPVDTVAADTVDSEGRLPNGHHPKGWRAPVDTTAKNILFIGDSMLEGLAPRLAKYCAANGHSLVEVIWNSSSTKVWGESTRLANLIKEHQPNYVVVCLGANELFVSDIKNARRHHVKKMLSDIGDIPYVWIGPPNWAEDTGINELIKEEVDEGCFYLSANDHFERSRDGAHPTRASAAQWMDRVVKWMNSTCSHPIRLNYPGEGNGRANRIIIFQPPK
jgi:lysophospholipase L1-like esterase